MRPRPPLDRYNLIVWVLVLAVGVAGVVGLVEVILLLKGLT